MVLDYPSCSFLVNDDCSAMMRGYGCWSEEASPLSSIRANSLWWEDMDPVDLLPTDPFGMNLENRLAAALASYIGAGAGRFGYGDGDAVSADLSYYLNQAFTLSWESLIGGYGSAFGEPFRFELGGLSSGGGADCSPGSPARGSCSQSIDSGENPSTSGNAVLACRGTADDVPDVQVGSAPHDGTADDVSAVQIGSAPHDGMIFALDYLGLQDILSVEMVCKSLHATVRNGLQFWKCVHIEPSLRDKIYDADLLRLTQKLPGSMQCLSIQGCQNITDLGLRSVLDSNPRLTKLNVHGCARLTLHGLIANLKSFNTKAVFGIKNLRIGRQFNLQKEYYEELLSSLNIDRMQRLNTQEPRFYHANYLLSDCSDGYALDIEMCPICGFYKLIFDCPEKGCDNRSGNCRACYTCIKRCLHCGRCVDENMMFEETFLLDLICYHCYDPVPPPPIGQKHCDSILPVGRIPSP